jgi:hypothetical protein
VEMKHLEEVNMSYAGHLGLAMLNSLRLLVSSVALFIHALFPFLFTHTASGLMEDVRNSFPKVGNDRILVRFNTKWKEDPEKRQWRVLVNGVETLANDVFIKNGSETVEEEISGEKKFHFLCFGKVTWQDGSATIT